MTAAVSAAARGTAAVYARFTGAVSALSAADRRALIDRPPDAASEICADTATIIRAVRADGDGALRDMARRLDGVELESLSVPRAIRRKALSSIGADLRRAMERSAANIAAVHRVAVPRATEVRPELGIIVGRRPDPFPRVGVYAPGGRAAYPSSVLMSAIPARIAGVNEIILCSPPDSTGYPSQVVLAAAELAAVDRVFAVGGAGAIAAMAVGTATVPRVDKVVGPGNAFVAEAKRQLAGLVSIDSPAGPSELLVIADATSDPDIVATEMLAQAEHDPMACVVAVCVGFPVAERVLRAIGRLIGSQPRADVIARALRGQGAVLWVDDISGAIEFGNQYAPEHLLLAVSRADAVVERVRRAGTVFVGEYSSVAFGDYMTGANHVLPTGGLARIYSGLSVLDFVRWTTYQRIDRDAAARLANDTALFAEAEGLPTHAAAARLRCAFT